MEYHCYTYCCQKTNRWWKLITWKTQMKDTNGVKVLRWNTLKSNKALGSDHSPQEVFLYLEISERHDFRLMPMISAREECAIFIVCMVKIKEVSKVGFHTYWCSLILGYQLSFLSLDTCRWIWNNHNFIILITKAKQLILCLPMFNFTNYILKL